MLQILQSEQLWEREKDSDGTHKSWYDKAVAYWDQQEASYDGVLGGFGHTSDVDVRDSRSLLLKAFKATFAKQNAKDLVAVGAHWAHVAIHDTCAIASMCVASAVRCVQRIH